MDYDELATKVIETVNAKALSFSDKPRLIREEVRAMDLNLFDEAILFGTIHAELAHRRNSRSPS